MSDDLLCLRKEGGQPVMTILDSQLEYYRARAGEYDEWFFRTGRYDRGPDANQRWHDGLAHVRSVLDTFQPSGDVLEFACGTGLWTMELAKHADSVLAVDGAAEMLAINRQRNAGPKVTCVQANIFGWTPPRQFDVVFFGFWLSHVPEDQFRTFWETVRAGLKPSGRVFFVDSLANPESRAKDHPIAVPSENTQVRYLKSGRRFEIVKRYYCPDALQNALHELGWQATIRTTAGFFLYGEASLR